MVSLKRYCSYVIAIAISICASVFAHAVDFVKSSMPEFTPEKASAELEQAKQYAQVTDNRQPVAQDTETAISRNHVSMLRGIGSEVAFA